MIVSLFLCVSCGLVRDAALAVLEEAKPRPGLALPDLPAGNTMLPETAAEGTDREKLGFFDEMIDTEGLLGSRRAPWISDVEGSYSLSEGGFYIKDTPFMGRGRDRCPRLQHRRGQRRGDIQLHGGYGRRHSSGRC